MRHVLISILAICPMFACDGPSCADVVTTGAIAVSVANDQAAPCVACAPAVKVSNPPAESFADITLADLKQAIADKKVTLLDKNGSESFAAGHIPSAIDFASIKDLAKALPADKAALIVAYCGGPKCSAWKAAAKAAADLGYTNIKHFSGGLTGWTEGGEKLVATTK